MTLPGVVSQTSSLLVVEAHSCPTGVDGWSEGGQRWQASEAEDGGCDERERGGQQGNRRGIERELGVAGARCTALSAKSLHAARLQVNRIRRAGPLCIPSCHIRLSIAPSTLDIPYFTSLDPRSMEEGTVLLT